MSLVSYESPFNRGRPPTKVTKYHTKSERDQIARFQRPLWRGILECPTCNIKYPLLADESPGAARRCPLCQTKNRITGKLR